MTPPSSQRLVARLREYASDGAVRNLQAQAHARAILQELGSPRATWPRFREDLDQKLYYGAHFQIWSALELLEQGQAREEAQQALLTGAESLEFLCEDPGLDDEFRSEQSLKAGFAYYIAGHYARSYVLINKLLERTPELRRPLALLLAVMRKLLQSAREITLDVFSDGIFADDAIASELEGGTLEEDEAVSRAVFSSLTAAVSLYLEYLKVGDRALFEEALGIVNDMILVARENLFVDWWWWSFCLRHLLLEYDRGSLWRNLLPLSGGGPPDPLLVGYIRGGLRQLPPIVELWPSQIQAAPIVNRSDRPHFCLKMPTSSGKTQIAEVTILRFLMDRGIDEVSKCAYVAPFRSLAVEVERTLRRSLGGLGARVSEIYGGFDLSTEDRELIEKTNVLVATPEKFDALFRYAPELGSRIGLVIIDEGHVVSPDKRGLQFEFFVQRLLKRLAPTKCRFVFISAVLPNATEFAEWITGTSENLVESDWRPSRQMLGQLSWDGQAVRIDYTHSGKEEFGQECFVPAFITAAPCQGVPGLGRRRLPFPKDRDEAFALAAMQFAQAGMTLAFCPQKRQAEAFSRCLKEVLHVRQTLDRSKGRTFDLPKTGLGTPEWDHCMKAVETEMGPGSELLELLQAGIAMHHAGLPQRVRIAIEDLVRSRGIQLLVATTTLAQGVNLPIKTVLVRGLYHGHGDLVGPLTFWNIAGRAGRGMKETEGQILFCVDKTAPADQRSRASVAIRKMISALGKARVESALRLVLSMFVREWRSRYPNVNVSQLCLYLTENNLQWIPDDTRAGYQFWLDRLDGHLLALTEDFNLDPYTPDKLQEILSGSLLFIQLGHEEKSVLNSDEALAFLDARIRYIYKKHPERATRSRLFKLGFPLSDCESIEGRKDSLLALFLEAVDWSSWSASKRIEYLIGLADIVLELHELRPDKGLPAQCHALLEAWLSGSSSSEMAADKSISGFSDDPAEISLWIEDVCRYRLPWGINSVGSFLQSFAAESDLSLPPVCAHFASMFKYGVPDPVAVRLMPYLAEERDLAIALSAVSPIGADDLEHVHRWFMSLDPKLLEALGLDGEVASRIMKLQQVYRHDELVVRGRTLSIRLTFSDIASTGGLAVGDRVLIVPLKTAGDSAFRLWTLKGNNLGTFALTGYSPPDWWRETHLVVSKVTAVDSRRRREPIVTFETSEI